LKKEMDMIKQGGLANGTDPVNHPASNMVKELVGNNPRLEGLNPTSALTQLLGSTGMSAMKSSGDGSAS
jgi:hypothetical protein